VAGVDLRGNGEAGRDAVREIKKDGYDFVKVYNGLSRDAYFAIVDEAKKLGVPVAGHVPNDVGALAVTDAGQVSIEHLDGLILACSSEEVQLVKRMAAAFKKPKKNCTRKYVRALTRAAETYDEQKAASFSRTSFATVHGRCQRSRCCVFPDRLGDGDYLNDSRLKYVSSEVKSYWESRKTEEMEIRSAEAIVRIHEIWKAEIKLTGAMPPCGSEAAGGEPTRPTPTASLVPACMTNSNCWLAPA